MTALPNRCPATLTVGAWVDDAFGEVDAAYAARFRAAGMTQAALMTNRSNDSRSSPGWKLRSKPAVIALAAANLRDAGVEVILTCWPRPDREQLATLEREMGPLLDACAATAIEVDVEGNWHGKHLRGFKSLDEAAAELVAVLHRLAGGHRRIELNSYPGHAVFAPGSALVPHFDLVLPQAYSVNERRNSKGEEYQVAWDSALGPGRMQADALDRAARAGAKPTALVACGLAAYEQRFAGHPPAEAMQVAVDAARDRGCTIVRYWSSKWLVGSLARRQPWAEKFVRSLGVTPAAES